jgi:hypothetical protein
MNKADLYQTLIDQLQQELATVTAAAKSSFATATSDAHHAEGKYDTFSLETSYLARGQAKRVAELHDALSSPRNHRSDAPSSGARQAKPLTSPSPAQKKPTPSAPSNNEKITGRPLHPVLLRF